MDDDDLTRRLATPRYPRSRGYDARWVVDGWMGPNPLWLVEWLTDAMDLRPGQRVLDLGCGRATTSVFLAREFGVQVVAADLWTDPAVNWDRIGRADARAQVLPLRVEAHDLPFAHGYFDAVVSVDAYHYFGTDQLYLAYLRRFLADGAQVGIAVPGLAADPVPGVVPASLQGFWHPEFASFHTPAWWRGLWESSGVVDVLTADRLDDGWDDWVRWTRLCQEAGVREDVRELVDAELPMLQADGGENLGFTRVVARCR